jgi:hypothetical protein
VAEWLKAHAWKVCLGLNLTWVRIPPPPPNTNDPLNCGFFVLIGLGRDENPNGSTKTSGKFLNKLRLARKVGEGIDSPNEVTGSGLAFYLTTNFLFNVSE